MFVALLLFMCVFVGVLGHTTTAQHNDLVVTIANHVTNGSLTQLVARKSEESNALQTEMKIQNSDFAVDLVVTWVDGDNTVQIATRNHIWDQVTREKPGYYYDGKKSNRNRQKRNPHSLRLFVQTIFQTAPWLRKVHLLVSDSDHAPNWLPANDNRFEVHHHSEVFENRADLPTFNSFAIECWIDRVPGLADHFIYINDDMLFAKQLSRDLFFTTDGIPSFWPNTEMGRVFYAPDKIKEDSYWGTIRMSNNAIKASKLAPTLDEMKWGYFSHVHQARPLTRSLMQQVREQFPIEIRQTSGSQFRSLVGVWAIHLAYQIGLATKQIVVHETDADQFLFGMLTSDMDANKQLLQQMQSGKFKLICINRDYFDEELDRKFEAVVTSILEPSKANSQAFQTSQNPATPATPSSISKLPETSATTKTINSNKLIPETQFEQQQQQQQQQQQHNTKATTPTSNNINNINEKAIKIVHLHTYGDNSKP